MFAANNMGVPPAGSGYLYWRLNITDNNGQTDTVVAELQMMGVIGGIDLCTGGTASASDGTASLAFDKSFIANWWLLTGTTGWLRYQFASPVNIVQYVVYFPTGLAAGYAPKNWTLEASNDGTTWETKHTPAAQTTWTVPSARTFNI